MMLQRKLGLWETICKFAHDFYHGTGNVVAFAEVSGNIEPKLFHKTCKILFEKHPLLKATIHEKWYQLYFLLNTSFESIPFEFLQLQDSNAWKMVIENEMKQPFTIENNLWRVKLLLDITKQTYKIVFIFHHAIADGLALASLVNQCMAIYSEVSQNRLVKTFALPLLDNIEKLLPHSKDWPHFIADKTQVSELLSNKFPFKEFAPIANRNPRNIYVSLENTTLCKLQSISRKQEISINSILNAALLTTIHQMEPTLATTSLHTPINLRLHCQPNIEAESIGCFISMVTTVHQDLQCLPSFWQIAQNYKNQLDENIPKIGYCPGEFDIAEFDIVELTRIFDMAGSTKRKFFTSGFGISNLGNISFDTFQNHTIESFQFCTNRMMGDFIVFINIVTVNDKMNLCFTYTEPLVSTLWVQQLADHFIMTLNQAIIQNKE